MVVRMHQTISDKHIDVNVLLDGMSRNGRDMNRTGMLPCLPKVIGVLQPEPMRRVRFTERHFKPQCHFRRDRSTPVQHLGQRLAAHTKMVGCVGDGQAQGVKHQLL